MPPFMKLTDVVCKFQTYLSLFYLECCFYYLLGSFLSFVLLQVWTWGGPVPPVCAGLIRTTGLCRQVLRGVNPSAAVHCGLMGSFHAFLHPTFLTSKMGMRIVARTGWVIMSVIRGSVLHLESPFSTAVGAPWASRPCCRVPSWFLLSSWGNRLPEA